MSNVVGMFVSNLDVWKAQDHERAHHSEWLNNSISSINEIIVSSIAWIMCWLLAKLCLNEWGCWNGDRCSQNKSTGSILSMWHTILTRWWGIACFNSCVLCHLRLVSLHMYMYTWMKELLNRSGLLSFTHTRLAVSWAPQRFHVWEAV